MKTFVFKIFLLMLVAAPMLFNDAYGQSIADRNYPPFSTNVQLKESNLPIVLITTPNKLNRFTREMGRMVVINNGQGALNYSDTTAHKGQKIECNLPIALKWRGSSSFGNDGTQTKKPISIKTLKEGATLVTDKKEKVKLLNMGKDNDWALLAPWHDVSYVRDVLTMELARDGYTYAPRMRFCEVMFNGVYYGVYILSERATKGDDRLDLWDYDNKKKVSEEDVYGDFHVEIDRAENFYTHEKEPHYTSKYHPVWSSGLEITDRVITYQYKDPEEEDFVGEEWGESARSYLHTAIDRMEESFRTDNYAELYPQYIDINSFIDFEIAQEHSNNLDGYRLSAPMWKYCKTHAQNLGTNDKWKIALWDFNVAYGHRTFGLDQVPIRDAWRYTANDILHDANNGDGELIPFFWYKLMNDDAYISQLKARYTQRRQTRYTDQRVNAICDSIRELLDNGPVNRDNQAWRNQFNNWKNEIEYVKQYSKDRLAWMDARWYVDGDGYDNPFFPSSSDKAIPLVVDHGYNMDVICENNSSWRDFCNSVFTHERGGRGIDESGYVFYTSSVDRSGALCGNDGLYSSNNADYYIEVSGNNALVMKNNYINSGTLTLASPVQLRKLYVTGTSTNGENRVRVTVNYSDGTSSSAVEFYMPDWYNASSGAVNGLYRMDQGRTIDRRNFSIFEIAIPTDANKEVRSVSFSHSQGQSAVIFSLSGEIVTTNFKLTGTTFWKDGSWNTLCLPFNLNDINDTPLEGAIIKTLESSHFDEETSSLELYFTDENLTSLKAGRPYIVKWESGNNVDNPEFKNVVKKGSENPVVTEAIDFIGCYNQTTLEGGDRSVLYLGANNTLYYPAVGYNINIKPYHAYFKLKGLTAGGDGAKDIRAINIDFNDDPQGIQTVVTPQNELLDYWFTLDGRRLSDKPSTPGIYLHQGRRVMIK